ncbi:glycosyltransferase family 4 protein [Tamlana sp. 2_MG-2023]|uniref:glycosyltransferase family 4 protein n=1 Tax=unclassified Tamlana TaxID=2614803 RepID=UPI0026E2C65F|nr:MULTISPECIES: glycosyltransferase family 4 protein [unclassified Tamlana]MDO6759067.1 glycosyltransferase family 4 protein [Tamlana sp. 2_MG-2023]MDO6789766.1 glycosyltransferase family 4 protein [Tamlana sp. 1_MG-2023]
MVILHVSGVSNWGGGENHIENLYYELEKSELEVTQYVFCVKNGDFHKRLTKGNYNCIPATLGLKIDPRFIFKLIRVCRSKKVDAIHIHDPTALTLSVIADRISGNLPPFIFSKKTSFEIKNRKSTRFKYNYKKIEKYICVSKAVADVTAKAIENTDKIITIYNGIRFSNKTTHTDFKLREKFNIPANKIIVGNIGNHIRAKNLLTFLNVINDIVNVKKLDHFHFIQIGSFTKKTEVYTDKVKELNLEDHITFTDFIDNASNYIPQFDIFMLTSQSEGLPQVINEAFYFKTPVISTNPGGIPEIIENGVNGFLSEVNDYQTLSDNLVILNSDKALQTRFIEKSYHQITNGFSSEIMARKTFDVYKAITQKPTTK